MKLIKLQAKIKKTLKNNSFNLINEVVNKDNSILVVEFNNILKPSTFYINNKNDEMNEVIIGANITLDAQTLTKSVFNRIQYVSARYKSLCSLSKYNKNDQGIVLIQNECNLLKYKEKDFLLQVKNFQECMIAIYNDIHKYLKYKDVNYLDLSMFEAADWSVFDPYKYIIERDKKFNGSWDLYIHMLSQSHVEEKPAELVYVEMCKSFEDENNIPIDLACEYIIDKIMQCVGEEKEIN